MQYNVGTLWNVVFDEMDKLYGELQMKKQCDGVYGLTLVTNRNL